MPIRFHQLLQLEEHDWFPSGQLNKLACCDSPFAGVDSCRTRSSHSQAVKFQ